MTTQTNPVTTADAPTADNWSTVPSMSAHSCACPRYECMKSSWQTSSQEVVLTHHFVQAQNEQHWWCSWRATRQRVRTLLLVRGNVGLGDLHVSIQEAACVWVARPWRGLHAVKVYPCHSHGAIIPGRNADGMVFVVSLCSVREPYRPMHRLPAALLVVMQVDQLD